MTPKSSGRWLKKYTELRHLEGILVNRQLHLADPSIWPDKNDSELVEIYSKAISAKRTRVTCMTMAADRFHFWTVFGDSTQGVCLWFDRKALIEDIGADSSLEARAVDYITPSELSEITLSRVPFAKRKQYQDEREFRVLREYYDAGDEHSDKFSFSPESLVRIYLNPWLSRRAVEDEKSRIQRLLKCDMSHVETLQNRMIRKEEWIDAAKRVAVRCSTH